MACNCGGTSSNCNCDCENITLPVGPAGTTGATGPAGAASTIPGPAGNDGADGTSPWLMKMTNEAMAIPGSQGGDAIIPSGPHNILTLYHGTTQIDMNIQYLSVPNIPGLGILIEQDGNGIDLTLTDWITGETYRGIDLTYTDPVGGVFVLRWDIVMCKQGTGFIYYGESTTAPTDPYLGLWYRNPNTGIDYFWDGSAWQILVMDGTAGATDITDITDGGTVVVQTPTMPKQHYVTGDAALASAVTISPSAGVWADGTTQKFLYRATLDTNGYPVTIYGKELTAAQAKSGNIDISSTYVEGAGWLTSVTNLSSDESEQNVWIEITPTQIKQLYQTHVVLIDAPGAGKFIYYTVEAYYLKFNSIAYANGGTLAIAPHDWALGGDDAFGRDKIEAVIVHSAQSVLIQPDDPWIGLGPGEVQNVVENNAIELYQDGGAHDVPYITGDSSLWIKLRYKIVTLPA